MSVTSLPLATDTRCVALVVCRQTYSDVTHLCHVIQKDVVYWLGSQWLRKSGLQFFQSNTVVLAVWDTLFPYGKKFFEVKQSSDSSLTWTAIPFPQEVFGSTGMPLLLIANQLKQYGADCQQLVSDLWNDKIGVKRNDVGDYVVSCKLNDFTKARDLVLQHVINGVKLRLWGNDDVQFESVYVLPKSIPIVDAAKTNAKTNERCEKSVRCASLTWLLWKQHHEKELAERDIRCTVTNRDNDTFGGDINLELSASYDAIQWLESQLQQTADDTVVFSADMTKFGSRRMQQFVKRIVSYKFDVVFSEEPATDDPSSSTPYLLIALRQNYVRVSEYLSDLASQVKKTCVSADKFLSLVHSNATFVTPTTTDSVPVVVVDSSGLYFYVPASDTIVYVVEGNIIQQRVDVIVSATDEALTNRSGVSREIQDGGGVELRQLCDELLMRRANWMLDVGDVEMTASGRLPFSHVLHAVSPRWHHHGNSCHQLLRDTIVKCLMKAAAAGATSIAIPAIGAGQSGVPIDIVIAAMFEAVMSFSTTASSDVQKLHDIVFVMPSTDVLRVAQRMFYVSLTSAASPPVLDQSQSTLRGGSLSSDDRGLVKEKKERGSKTRWYDPVET